MTTKPNPTDPQIKPVSDSLTPASDYPEFRTAYSPRKRVAVYPRGEDLTKQSFKDECDINILMQRYQDTGMLDHVNQAEPRYADVTAMDYQEAMDIIADANSMFYALPSEIRDRFGNDPQRVLEFAEDPRNEAEAVELGFLDQARLEAIRKARADSEPKANRGDEGAAGPEATAPPPGKAEPGNTRP